jgi:hypothetical protein
MPFCSIITGQKATKRCCQRTVRTAVFAVTYLEARSTIFPLICYFPSHTHPPLTDFWDATCEARQMTVTVSKQPATSSSGQNSDPKIGAAGSYLQATRQEINLRV